MRIVCTLLFAAMALGSVATAASPPAPTVRITAAAPLTVTGRSFASRERLKLVVVVDDVRRVRTIRTDLAGRFTSRFTGVTPADRCSISARAIRPSGRVVVAKLPAPLCPPALVAP